MRFKISTRIISLTILLSFLVLLCGGIALWKMEDINNLFYETAHYINGPF